MWGYQFGKVLAVSLWKLTETPAAKAAIVTVSKTTIGAKVAGGVLTTGKVLGGIAGGFLISHIMLGN